MADSCKTCQYYQDTGCHRLPPQVLLLDGRIVSVWPGVQENLWCGEYQLKPLVQVTREMPRGN